MGSVEKYWGTETKTARLRRKTNLQKSDYPKTRTKRVPNALCVVEYDNCVCII